MALMCGYWMGGSDNRSHIELESEDGLDNVEIVQQAMMMHPTEPVKMFASARAGLSVNNNLRVTELEFSKFQEPRKEVDPYAIADAITGGGISVRTLFNRHRENYDTYATVLFGVSKTLGTVLIMYIENIAGITVVAATNHVEVDKEASLRLARTVGHSH